MAFPQRPLGAIARVRQGHSFRQGLEPDPDGDVKVVQARNLRDDGTLSTQDLVRIQGDPLIRAFLMEDDLVFQPRGVTHTASLSRGIEPNTIVAAPLFIFSLVTPSLDPSYLAFFINNTITQDHLRSLAVGTHVPQLSRASIDRFNIPIPPIQIQLAIVEAARLSRRQASVVAEMHSLRMTLLHAASIGAISFPPQRFQQ